MSDDGLPNDAYGRTVTMTSDGVTDLYMVGGALEFGFPAGTGQAAVYLSIAKQTNLAKFSAALNDFASLHYTIDVRQNLIGLYINAQQTSKSNRQAYISQIFTWQNSVIGYAATYVATINSLSDPAVVATTTWNFLANVSADPMISPIAAVQIPN